MRIAYDSADQVAAGDALVTTTGRIYAVLEARQQEKGKHRGRWHLRCAVVDSWTDDGGHRSHPLVWYPRARKRAGRPPGGV